MARRPDDTAPSQAKALACPRCRKVWTEALVTSNGRCPADGTSLVRAQDLPDPSDDPMVGRTLEGRYTIVSRLGAGSMGTVYRARQHAMGREVAIKILRGDRAIDDTAKARFMREARANSLLASPNTVTVFDFGESESGEFYLAMELLEGESLGQRLTRATRLPAALAVDAARQALRSLAEAHAKGIIHRDLKPDNLFFARVLTGSMRPPSATAGPGTPTSHEEIVKVLDFGIAKMLNTSDDGMGVVETQAGTVFGTPRYMSPEQAQGKPLDARSDLYALGVILYQMLTGKPPFNDDDAVVVMARHIKSNPKRPSDICPEARIPKDLEDVIMRALAKDPEARPATAEVFAGELLAALEAQGANSSGVRPAVTNAAGITLPGSMRPPSMTLPPAPRRAVPLAAVLLVGIVILVGAIVFLVLTGRGGRAAGTSPRRPDPAMPAPPSKSASVDAPLVPMTPDALPTAVEAATEPDGPAGTSPSVSAVRARPRAPTAPPKPASRGSSTSSAPTPAAASPYGIFD